MKLLIDIPNELKTEVRNHGLFLCPNDKISLVNAIKHGVPLDNLTADLETLREPTEPHLVDYRYHRNDMLDMVLGVIERYRNEVSE